MGTLAGSLSAPTIERHRGYAVFAAGLCVFVALPLATVVSLSIGSPWYSIYARLFERPEIIRIILRTLLVAVITAAITVGLALPVALTIGFSSTRRRLALLWLFAIAGFSPFLVRGYAFVGLLGEHGPVDALRRLLQISGGPLLGTAAGVVVTLVHALIPATVIIITAAISDDTKRQISVAAAFGAGPADRFLLVTLPTLIPSLVSAFAFAFIIAAGAFTAPSLVGGGRETLAVQVIYMHAIDLDDLKSAAALSILLALCILLCVAAIIAAFGSKRSRPGSLRRLRSVAAPLRRVSPRVLGAGGTFLRVALTSFAIILVAVPLVYVVAVSFQPQDMLAFPTDGLSVRWYRQVLADSSWLHAAAVTARIGIVAALLATSAGYLVAQATRQLRPSSARVVRAATIAPAAAPAVMFGVGLYVIASRIGLAGTEFGVALAHALAALPIAYLAVSAGVERYDDSFDRAAAVLGASPAARLIAIRLPILMPSFVAALVLSLLVSFDEVIMTLFMAGTDVQTIALRMWSSAIHSAGPELAVPSAFLLVVTGLGMLILFAQFGSPTDLTKRNTNG